jgi:hypothetical protein
MREQPRPPAPPEDERDHAEVIPDEDRVVNQINRTQLQRFTDADPRCRGLELPEGLMLRYALARSLYFYLRTGVKDGKIMTRIYASDSPYDRQKSNVGEVKTPMFEPRADAHHLDKVERLLYAWVDFVKDEADAAGDFRSFAVDGRA